MVLAHFEGDVVFKEKQSRLGFNEQLKSTPRIKW